MGKAVGPETWGSAISGKRRPKPEQGKKRKDPADPADLGVKRAREDERDLEVTAQALVLGVIQTFQESLCPIRSRRTIIPITGILFIRLMADKHSEGSYHSAD